MSKDDLSGKKMDESATFMSRRSKKKYKKRVFKSLSLIMVIIDAGIIPVLYGKKIKNQPDKKSLHVTFFFLLCKCRRLPVTNKQEKRRKIHKRTRFR